MSEKVSIDVRIHGYPNSNGYVKNDTCVLECSMEDIIRSCIHAGKSKDVNVAPYEVVFRVALIRMSLNETYIDELKGEGGEKNKIKKKRFVSSETFDEFDPSEKGGVSFFLGMTMAKMVAEKYFQTPWVMHYDVYKNNGRYDIDIEPGEKPDLFGLGEAKDVWNIFEAKGSSDGYSSRATQKGKKQKRRIKHINNCEIKTSNVVQFYFGGKEKILRIDLADPEVDKGESVQINYRKYFCEYYGLICNLIEAVDKMSNHVGVKSSEYKGTIYDIVDLPCVDIRIGIPRIVRKTIYMLNNNGDCDIEEGVKEKFIFEPLSEDENEDGVSIGRDGFLVSLGETWRTKD